MQGTVVLIHGLYLNARCWDPWKGLLERRGYTVRAESWPLHDGDPASLRASPPPGLRELTLGQVVAAFRAIVRELPEPPVLIGHSMGGLVVQLLLAEGLGRAGVAIDSAPPKGLTSLRWSFLKTNLPLLTGREPLLLSEEQFRYAFTHTLPEDQAAGVYATYVVPESRVAGRGPTTNDGKVDFKARKAPLLLMSGEVDRVIPAGLNARNAKRYEGSGAVTAHRTFPGRSHWIIGEPGWEEVANEALDWVERQAPPG